MKDFMIRVMEQFEAEVFSELKFFRDDMTGHSTCVQFSSNKIFASNSLMAEIKNKFAEMKNVNEGLRSENTGLWKEVRCLNGKMWSLEQYMRCDNIEISGIPFTPNEDVATVIRIVGKALDLNVSDGCRT